MPTYIPVTIETEPVDLAAQAFDYLQSKIPDWDPATGNLESWLIEANALTASELRLLAAAVPEDVFVYFGSTILGIPPYPAVQATAMTTWTAGDTAGYSVAAGTVIAITPPASSEAIPFFVVDTFWIQPGTTTVAGIECRALEAGAAGTGLTGDVQVIDALQFVAGVTLDAPTSGGQDAETTDAYVDRLSALLTLLSPRPILPRDFALLAASSFPQISRAVAIDLYNPGPPVNANCPRCVSVAVVGADGQPCPPDVKADVDALLQSQREVNFLVFVVDPTYTTIDVSFDVAAYPGYDATDVHDRVVSAVTNFLSPDAWGVPPYGDTSGASWINDTEVRYLDLAKVVNDVDGVRYIVTLALGVHGSALGQADVTLAGVAPLPNPGNIVGTVEPTS